jgi:hypothetical protein
MKKYNVWGQIGSTQIDREIEADYFSCGEGGFYVLKNSQTKEEWYFPVNKIVIERIIE